VNLVTKYNHYKLLTSVMF